MLTQSEGAYAAQWKKRHISFYRFDFASRAGKTMKCKNETKFKKPNAVTGLTFFLSSERRSRHTSEFLKWP